MDTCMQAGGLGDGAIIIGAVSPRRRPVSLILSENLHAFSDNHFTLASPHRVTHQNGTMTKIPCQDEDAMQKRTL